MDFPWHGTECTLLVLAAVLGVTKGAPAGVLDSGLVQAGEHQALVGFPLGARQLQGFRPPLARQVAFIDGGVEELGHVCGYLAVSLLVVS